VAPPWVQAYHEIYTLEEALMFSLPSIAFFLANVQFKRVSFRKRDNVVEKDKQSKQKSDILF
jgi:hypothetical protein